MRVRREFLVPNSDPQRAARCLDYLRDRGFANARVFVADGNAVIEGTRGSWFGNLFSFDMTKLRARIRLTSDVVGKTCVELDINTFGQEITDWNLATWRLELVELRRVLLGLGRIDHVWRRFGPERRAAAIRWTASARIGGKKLTLEWEAELSRLEAEPHEGSSGAA